MELFVCLLRPPRSFARSAARGRCRSAFRHEYVRPKTARHSLCLSAQLPSEDVQRTSVEIGNHRNTLLRHKGRVNQVEVAMSLVQEGASLRTGACNRAEHQRQRWHDPLRLSFPFPQPTHRDLLKELQLHGELGIVISKECPNLAVRPAVRAPPRCVHAPCGCWTSSSTTRRTSPRR